MGWPHSAKIGRPMGQTDTGVETMYFKAQRGTAACQMDRRCRQYSGKSVVAGGTGTFGVTHVLQWTAIA